MSDTFDPTSVSGRKEGDSSPEESPSPVSPEETPSSETPQEEEIPEAATPLDDLMIDWGDEKKGEAPEPPKPNKQKTVPFTRAKAKEAKAQEDRGFLFTLLNTRDPETHLPMTIRVRRVNMLDSATMGHLPRAIQAKLLELQAERARMQAKYAEMGPDEKLDASTILRELHRTKEMANAYMMAGSMEPRVYATEQEADQKGGAWINEIHELDRMTFMGVCDGAWEDAVSVLTPFPEQSARDVATGEAREDSPETIEDFALEEDTPLTGLRLVQSGA